MPPKRLIEFAIACQLIAASWASGQSEEGKSVPAGKAVADPNDKVATVLGRDIFRREIDPPESWYEQRAKYLAKNGHTKGFESEEGYRRAKLWKLIWGPLVERFGGKQDAEPTDEELQEFTKRYRQSREYRAEKNQKRLEQLKSEVETREKLLASNPQPPMAKDIEKQLDKLQKEIKTIETTMENDRKSGDETQETFLVRWYVGNWKGQQWYYRRYGGRVIYQQLGPEALDGMRDFLKEQESKDRFAIYDDKCKSLLWDYFTNDKSHVFAPNPEQIFEHPWALLDLPPESAMRTESANGK